MSYRSFSLFPSLPPLFPSSYGILRMLRKDARAEAAIVNRRATAARTAIDQPDLRFFLAQRKSDRSINSSTLKHDLLVHIRRRARCISALQKDSRRIRDSARLDVRARTFVTNKFILPNSLAFPVGLKASSFLRRKVDHRAPW